MKKVSFLIVAFISVGALQFCTSTRKAAKAPAITYMQNIQPVMSASCTPCHFPPKGRAKALDSYDAVKTNSDDIISRVQRNPGEKGFMPMKHPKLPDSTINLFVQWKTDGLLEK